MPQRSIVALFLGGGQTQPREEILAFARKLQSAGFAIRVDQALLAEALGLAPAPAEELLCDCRFAVGFGGDGTILRLARSAAVQQVPVLGINFGQLGFLAESGAHELEKVADLLIGECYEIAETGMLRADYGDESIFALNDIVIRRQQPLEVLRARVFVDGQHLDDYVADGLLVATTTGASAYALSCGGPIIDPSLEATSFTPICPHSLRARSILMNPRQTVEARVFARSLPAMVCADGRDLIQVQSEDAIRIGPAPYKARFIRLKNGKKGFYTKVWSKLVDRTQ